FLPLIEQHPLSEQLCEWVLGSALGQMEAWRDAGQDISVSVNISAYQMQQDNFVSLVTRQLDAHPALGQHRLEIELLETSALANLSKVASMMHACQGLGLRFALDDFGTGYSALTHLRHLPADRLKIDQSFVSGMLADANDRAIVESVIGLSRAFQREVIAEGVETPSHGALLLELGCEVAQGFGIAHPMAGADLPAWIAEWDMAWAAARHAWHGCPGKRSTAWDNSAP
ncbi:MAG: hypothetical protein RLZZ555_2082, partial [Pseudomonadota bacterium]